MKKTFYKFLRQVNENTFTSYYAISRNYVLGKEYVYMEDEPEEWLEGADDLGYCGARDLIEVMGYSVWDENVVLVKCEGELLDIEEDEWEQPLYEHYMMVYGDEECMLEESCYGEDMRSMPEYHFKTQKIIAVVGRLSYY